MRAAPQILFGRLLVSVFPSLLVAALLTGCGGKNFKPYVHSAGSVTMVAAQHDGVTFIVDPLLDPVASKKNFGMNCLEKGILPVYLSVTNSNPDASFRIVTRDIWFAFGDGDVQQARGWQYQTNYSSAGTSVGIAGGATLAAASTGGGLLLLGIGMKMTDDEESIRENFFIKQFQNVTLTPGKSANGFVYFTQTNPISSEHLPAISIPVQNLQTHQTNVAVFTLNPGRNPK